MSEVDSSKNMVSPWATTKKIPKNSENSIKGIKMLH